MNKFLWIPIISLMCLVSACGDKNINIKTSPVEIDVARPADPAPVRMLPVQWIVVTKDNLNDVINKMAAQSAGEYVFIAISPKDYENLVLNIADLRRYIEQEQAIVVYYKNITTVAPDKKP